MMSDNKHGMICLNCGKKEEQTQNPKCGCEEPAWMDFILCEGCEGMILYICDSEYHGLDEAYCPDCNQWE